MDKTVKIKETDLYGNKRFPLNLSNSGIKDCSDLHSFGPEVRDVYIIHYVIKGSGYYEINGKKHRVQKGQSFIIFPNSLVKYYPDELDPWVYTWVDFFGIEANRIMSYTSFDEKNPIAYISDGEPEKLFDKARKEFSLAGNPALCRNTANLLYVLSYYIEKYPSQTETSPKSIVEFAVSYIESNYRHEWLNTDYLAAHLNVSRITLYRHFTKHLGTTPSKFISDYRIQKACELLTRRDLSVKNISYSVGFSDQLYFSKAFKAKIGVSPSKYKSLNSKLLD